jgi:hypothetical protein
MSVVDDASRRVEDGEQLESLARAFVLGIADSANWNSLGTFAWRFMRRDDLAEQFYRTSMRLNARSPVPATNLARLLVRRRERLQEADALLGKAGSVADRHFTWWRGVRKDLEDARGTATRASPEMTVPSFLKNPASARHVGELSKIFSALQSGAIDEATRGHAFEKLVAALLRATPGAKFVVSNARQPVEGVAWRETDLVFSLNGQHYIGELKWKREPLHPDVIDSLMARLTIADVRGIVISMSGFTDGCIAAASEQGKLRGKRVLLLDGTDIADVFECRRLIHEVIDERERGLTVYKHPFYRPPKTASAGSAEYN